MRAVEVGYQVVAVEADPARAKRLESGGSYVQDIPSADRKKGLAIEIRALHLTGQVQRQLVDPESALSRWSGRLDDGTVRRRAQRSPYFAFRLAMLDEWQTLFGSNLVWDS